MQAQVYKIHSDFYYVKNSKHDEFVCKLKDVLKKKKIDVHVGDYVELSNDNQFIENVIERKNSLNRPKVANIDCVLVVSSLVQPELDLIQLNRYLTYLKFYNIDCAICFNKEDLVDDLENIKNKLEKIYSNLNYKIFFISAKNKLDLEDLQQFIKNKTIALCGMSGVGKSTLLNSLNGQNNLKTSEVSFKTLRGTHTTRHCEIIDFVDFKMVDTPGFSCLKFDFLLPEKLIDLFDDIKIFKLNCKYSNCLHDVTVSGICNVYDNLDKIEKTRYESYLAFLKESLEYKDVISKRSIKKVEFSKQVGNKNFAKISKAKRDASRNTLKQKIKDIHK